MAARTISRAFLISNTLHFSLLRHLSLPCIFPSPPFSSSLLIPTTTVSKPPFQSSTKPFYTSSAATAAHSETPPNLSAKAPKRNTLVNFSMSDSESDAESEPEKVVEKPEPPPPYDPFSKKPAIEEPKDPTNLQEVFHRIRADGLMNSAVKMFDGLSKDGLTHEALEMFSQIKDKGEIPEVVAHTAVIEAYVNAGQPKEGLKVFLRMMGCGVLPNAYTYSVLIRGLAASGDAKLVMEAKKRVVKMVETRGMKPNAAVCSGVYEGLAGVGMAEEGKEVLEMVKSKGFIPEDEKVREAVKDKRAHLRDVLSILFGK